MTQIGDWLDQLGLGEYSQIFAENAIDFTVVRDLTDDDLKEMGVLLGHRRRLLRAIAGLEHAAPSESKVSVEATREKETRRSGDRRVLTVLFCDLVGSTGLASQIDAEEWRDLLAAYHESVEETVGRLGGHVAQRLGDGAMVYFGYPRARENDAERAVRAGLAMQQALDGLNLRLVSQGKPQLSARIGMHAGSVVTDSDALVFGEVPNIAARVQAAAAPGTVWISADLQRLVAGMFVVEDQGPQNLKGVPAPLTLFRVVRVSGASRRRLTGRTLTPLAGREEELDVIARRWRRAQAGAGQMVLIVGEAGFGKSRLLSEFQGAQIATPHTWIDWSCSELSLTSPFHPLAEWAQQRFGGADVPLEKRIAELEAALSAVGLDLPDSLPLIAPALDLPVPSSYAKSIGGPEQIRRSQLASLVAWIKAGARSQSLVLAIEDVHWADPSTLELLRLLADQGSASQLLILLTSRPEFRAPWPHRSHHSVLTLAPLGRQESAQMVEDIISQNALPAETLAMVIERTAGVPLFLEEVTRLLVESGGRAGAHEVPPTLQASLIARLDRLGPAKEVAQIGAVLGREFSWSLIAAISGMTGDDLASGLSLLADADLILAEGTPPEANYRFKHALIQDAAYETLLKSRRREWHRVAGTILSGISATPPEIFAHHFTEAGDSENAILAWQLAGETAVRRTAFAEAEEHFRRGAKLLETMPDRSERARQEFKLRLGLGESCLGSRGHGATETRAAFEGALTIGERSEDPKTLVGLLSGLVTTAYQQADFVSAQAYADRLTALAQREGGDYERGWAACRQATISYCLGDLGDARRNLDQARSCIRSDVQQIAVNIELAVAVCLFAVFILGAMGELDAAQRALEEGLMADKTNGAPLNATYLKLSAVYCFYHRHDPEETEREALQYLELAKKRNSAQVIAYPTMFLGWSALASCRPTEALALMSEAINSHEISGSKFHMNLYLALLAQAQAATGNLNAALETVERAVLMNGLMPVMAPTVLRIKGDLLRHKAGILSGEPAAQTVRDAEGIYRQAALQARRMGAKLFELEAATALARLLRDRGELDAAYETLAPVLRSFTEGFATPPLKNARSVLEELR